MFPIIVEDQSQHCQKHGERRITIYCLAPLDNDFNETIQLTYQSHHTSYRTGVADPMEWGLNKGSSGTHGLEHTKLVAEGYQLAIRIMTGDDAVITPKAKVEAFHAYMSAKKDAQRALQAIEREETNKALAERAAKAEATRKDMATCQGTKAWVAVQHHGNSWAVQGVSSGRFYANKSNAYTKTFTTKAKALAFIKTLSTEV